MQIIRYLIAALGIGLLMLWARLPAAQTTGVGVQAGLASGPMPGHSAMRAVSIWLQGTRSGEVTLDYWPEGRSEQARTTAPVLLKPQQQYVAHIEIGALQPGTRYAYRVQIDGEPVPLPGKPMFRTQPLWQWRGEPPALRVLAGSCAYINEAAYDRPGKPYGDRYDIFARMAEQSADLMLWLGDNVYTREADFDSRWGMAERYRHARALPELQPLLRGTHHYAIWDDHDYGPDEANHSFVLKDQSLALFKRYWANPAYGLPGEAGIFTRVPVGDIDFFLLDNRYHRNSDRAPEAPDKTMLGMQQLAWLKDALLSSKAPFKIIANGSQLLNQSAGREGWINFPHERSAFLDWLEASGIQGILFLVGDAHFTALSRLEREGNYPLYELTCSPLTAGARYRDLPQLAFPPLPGTFVGERNFCQLDFSGPGAARRLTITVFDADGKPKWAREIAAAELQSPE